MINKLVLGTAGFGMNYGIANKAGKPSKSNVLKMLDYAYDNGITTFDTAFQYGDAEDLLGEFVSVNKLGGKIKIISKLQPNCIDDNTTNIPCVIHDHICKSLERLHIDKLDGYLLHSPRYIYESKITNALEVAKMANYVDNIGVSVYEIDDALFTCDYTNLNYIQLPYSVFDQRINKSDLVLRAKTSNVKLFVRTIFLQGLLFLEEINIPEHLKEFIPHLRLFNDILKKYNVSKAEAALSFATNRYHFDHIVIGVDNIEQLIMDIDIIKKQNDIKELIDELQYKFEDIPKALIFPSLWTKKQ